MQNAKGRHPLFPDDGLKNSCLSLVRRYPVLVITRRLARAVRVMSIEIRIAAGSREATTRLARANQFSAIRSPAIVAPSLFIVAVMLEDSSVGTSGPQAQYAQPMDNYRATLTRDHAAKKQRNARENTEGPRADRPWLGATRIPKQLQRTFSSSSAVKECEPQARERRLPGKTIFQRGLTRRDAPFAGKRLTSRLGGCPNFGTASRSERLKTALRGMSARYGSRYRN